MTPQPQTIQVPSDSSGKRLDVFIASILPETSRAQAQRLIADGCVTGPSPHHRLKASLTVMEGQVFHVRQPEAQATDIVPQEIALDVVFEDEDLIVLNKPVGLVAHPGAGNPDQTLVNALVAHCPQVEGVGGVKRPGLVHRLDKDTSGLLVAAKNDLAYRSLVRQLKARDVHRQYVGIVKGELKGAGKIEAPIGRSPYDRLKMAVRASEGKEARTSFKSLSASPVASFVMFKLETGRTHQIRAHAAFIHHPILGDVLYGGASELADRQMLHAFRLAFKHPRIGKVQEFVAPPPPDFLNCLKELGFAAPGWKDLQWTPEP